MAHGPWYSDESDEARVHRVPFFQLCLADMGDDVFYEERPDEEDDDPVSFLVDCTI